MNAKNISARDRFESLATEWNARGRPSSLLLEGRLLIGLRCWSWSQGAKNEGISEALKVYLHECEAAQPKDWIDAFLIKRERCRLCGEGYKLENIMLCTHCSGTICYRCAGEATKAANGNPECPCGGELVG